MRYLFAILFGLLCAAFVRAESPESYRARAALALAACPECPPARPVVQALLPGNHWHTCSRCGFTWQHSAASFGNVAAHTCARCGAVTWSQSAGPRTVLSFPVSAQNCPGGR